jgi:hypothetical protein
MRFGVLINSIQLHVRRGHPQPVLLLFPHQGLRVEHMNQQSILESERIYRA